MVFLWLRRQSAHFLPGQRRGLWGFQRTPGKRQPTPVHPGDRAQSYARQALGPEPLSLAQQREEEEPSAHLSPSTPFYESRCDVCSDSLQKALAALLGSLHQGAGGRGCSIKTHSQRRRLRACGGTMLRAAV